MWESFDMKMQTLPAVALALTLGSGAAPAMAQEYFLGQVVWTAFSFCPKGFAPANGQLLPINQNQGIFSLLGTTYGGNGQTTFALPNIQGRTLVNYGQGPGLPDRTVGEVYGTETTTLAANQMPTHSHTASTTVALRASSAQADSASPMGNVLANSRTSRIYSTAAANVAMAADALGAAPTVAPTGGGQPFNNVQPTLALTACIALQGIFPQHP